jgi:hypothetical protein
MIPFSIYLKKKKNKFKKIFDNPHRQEDEPLRKG